MCNICGNNCLFLSACISRQLSLYQSSVSQNIQEPSHTTPNQCTGQLSPFGWSITLDPGFLRTEACTDFQRKHASISSHSTLWTQTDSQRPKVLERFHRRTVSVHISLFTAFVFGGVHTHTEEEEEREREEGEGKEGSKNNYSKND